MSEKRRASAFQTMRLTEPILKGITQMGFKQPTPIQREAIPLIFSGHDTLIISRTGSGKTAAFAIPILDKLREHSLCIGARGLVILPTRELAIQTASVFRRLGKYTDLRICLLVGGDTVESQFEALSANPDILIGTPGRVLQLVEEISLPLGAINVIVVDEADKLMESEVSTNVFDTVRSSTNMTEQLGNIMSHLKASAQKVLVSATLTKNVTSFTSIQLHNVEVAKLADETRLPPTLGIQSFLCERSAKIPIFISVIERLRSMNDSRIIVFMPTKHHAELGGFIYNEYSKRMSLMTPGRPNTTALVIYGDMELAVRKIAMDKFRSETSDARVLITTDLAARGLDLPLVDYVVNYEFPPSHKLFIHRVGRCARSGRIGFCINIVTVDELPYLIDTYTAINYPIKLCQEKSLEDFLKCKTETTLLPTPGGPMDGLLGSFPRAVVDESIHTFDNFVSSARLLEQTFETYQKAATNAQKMYNKTRPAASGRAMERAKELISQSKKSNCLLGCNRSLFLIDETAEKTEENLEKLRSAVRNYRPKEDAFEYKKDVNDKGLLQTLPFKKQLELRKCVKNAILSTDFTGLNVNKDDEIKKQLKIEYENNERNIHQCEASDLDAIRRELGLDKQPIQNYAALTGEKVEEMKSDAGLDDEAMEFIPEDRDAIRKAAQHIKLQKKLRSGAQVWDPKRKKYVGIGTLSKNMERRRQEKQKMLASRSTVSDIVTMRGNKSLSSAYSEWSKRTNRSLGVLGETESDTATLGTSAAPMNSRVGYRNRFNPTRKQSVERAQPSKVDNRIERTFATDERLMKLMKRKAIMKRQAERNMRRSSKTK